MCISKFIIQYLDGENPWTQLHHEVYLMVTCTYIEKDILYGWGIENEIKLKIALY